MNELMKQLCRDVNARAAFVSDVYGRVLAKIGDLGDVPVETISALMGGGLATLMEAGSTVDSDPDAVYLAYREGKRRSLYSINIGTQHLLIVVIERGEYANRLGTVWYYTKQAALSLRSMVEHPEPAPPHEALGVNAAADLNSAFDHLFYSDDDTQQQD
ncbi:MAG: hypothetical protein U1B80_06925 [Anaerolineaceae bacterium]|nr:hypothetical protein [Anaerolineaceae bacterium]